MDNDFKEKLQLYKRGMLSESERVAIEKEIEKYEAIREYLGENDDDFINILKNEIDGKISKTTSIGKMINRKMIKKIISLSLATILACLIILPMLYISTLSVIGKAFRVEDSSFTQERVFADQFLQMTFPNVINTRGSDHTEFYKQKFVLDYKTGIGRKALFDKIEVNYSFGKLKKPNGTTNKTLHFFDSNKFFAINSETYFNSNEWTYLEKAPEGTQAQILITFKSKFSPEKALSAIGQQYFDPEKNFNITMFADINSEIVIGNANPVYYYEQNRTLFSKEDELNYINKFNAYENDTQKQVLLYGLNQIKNHMDIVSYITHNYSADNRIIFKNIANSISYVEENGVQYVGALISGDAKELLKLKNNPYIFACSVEDLVVW